MVRMVALAQPHENYFPVTLVSPVVKFLCAIPQRQSPPRNSARNFPFRSAYV
jgi:hypothetical protein